MSDFTDVDFLDPSDQLHDHDVAACEEDLDGKAQGIPRMARLDCHAAVPVLYELVLRQEES